MNNAGFPILCIEISVLGIFFIIFFIFNYKVLTYNTYLQTMYGTYATNKTILYLQNNTYLQCEILTLLTILYTLQYKACNTYLQWDTYTTNSAILHALHVYKKKHSYLHYLHYGLQTLQKPENKEGGEVW